MAGPEYIICLACETPCYIFEWGGEVADEAMCDACGNADPEQFLTPDEFEGLTADSG